MGKRQKNAIQSKKLPCKSRNIEKYCINYCDNGGRCLLGCLWQVTEAAVPAGTSSTVAEAFSALFLPIYIVNQKGWTSRNRKNAKRKSTFHCLSICSSFLNILPRGQWMQFIYMKIKKKQKQNQAFHQPSTVDTV